MPALRERIRGGELGTVHLVACYQWDERPPAAGFLARSGGIQARGMSCLPELRIGIVGYGVMGKAPANFLRRISTSGTVSLKIMRGPA